MGPRILKDKVAWGRIEMRPGLGSGLASRACVAEGDEEPRLKSRLLLDGGLCQLRKGRSQSTGNLARTGMLGRRAACRPCVRFDSLVQGVKYSSDQDAFQLWGSQGEPGLQMQLSVLWMAAKVQKAIRNPLAVVHHVLHFLGCRNMFIANPPPTPPPESQ